MKAVIFVVVICHRYSATTGTEFNRSHLLILHSCKHINASPLKLKYVLQVVLRCNFYVRALLSENTPGFVEP